MSNHLLQSLTILALAVAIQGHAFADNTALVVPGTEVIDHSLPKAQVEAQRLAALRYDTFWSNGDATLARAALAPGFIDQTLPPGRPQGIPGPLAASTFVRGAVPDMHCEVQQLIMAGDRVVTHLHFTGHFTGTFKGVQGKGQVVDFMATDIYRIANGKIAENWHLEDNLTFLQNLGIVAR